MTDADRMLVAACKTPADATVRSAAADAVREWGDPMLAHAIEDDDTGPGLLAEILSTSRTCGLPVSVNLAWAQFHVLSRMMTPVPPSAGSENIRPGARRMSAEEMERNFREVERDIEQTKGLIAMMESALADPPKMPKKKSWLRSIWDGKVSQSDNR